MKWLLLTPVILILLGYIALAWVALSVRNLKG